MTTWFNPRVAVVALSIAVLLRVSQMGEPEETMRRACVACAVLFLLYAAAFLLPIWGTLGFKRVVLPGTMLFAAWTFVALALVADAWPVTMAERMERQWNWPMTAFCVAGTITFFFFFQSASKALLLREEILEARHGRD